MRLCPQCGAALVVSAKFCVECGEQLAQSATSPARAIRSFRVTPSALAIFTGIIAVGMVGIIALAPRTPGDKIAAGSAAAPSVGAANNKESLPEGHPKIELPPEARKLIDEIEQTASRKPGDIAAWNRLGEVSTRAAMFDSSYYPKALAAYAHALKIDPDNLEALRGVGNVNYDRQRYDQAIAAYEHYLNKKPGDEEVRTDLGTMYLYTGNPDQAVAQYKRVIGAKPDFFAGYFNLGIAYQQMRKSAEAKAALEKAIALAPDDKSRARARELLAKLSGATAPVNGSTGLASGAPSASGAGSFESAIEQMVKAVPFAGPKVKSVEWTSRSRARVMMQDFPMGQMPPFARAKFLGDLRSGIDGAKTSHKITGKFELEIADAASGRVMETVSR